MLKKKKKKRHTFGCRRVCPLGTRFSSEPRWGGGLVSHRCPVDLSLKRQGRVLGNCPIRALRERASPEHPPIRAGGRPAGTLRGPRCRPAAVFTCHVRSQVYRPHRSHLPGPRGRKENAPERQEGWKQPWTRSYPRAHNPSLHPVPQGQVPASCPDLTRASHPSPLLGSGRKEDGTTTDCRVGVGCGSCGCRGPALDLTVLRSL